MNKFVSLAIALLFISVTAIRVKQDPSCTNENTVFEEEGVMCDKHVEWCENSDVTTIHCPNLKSETT